MALSKDDILTAISEMSVMEIVELIEVETVEHELPFVFPQNALSETEPGAVILGISLPMVPGGAPRIAQKIGERFRVARAQGFTPAQFQDRWPQIVEANVRVRHQAFRHTRSGYDLR